MRESNTTSPDPNGPLAAGEMRLDDAARSAIRTHASPEGIVAILFTDIVESTRMRQRLGDDAAQQRMREHNAVVRAQIAKHGGFEVKTQGDGFMIAFSDVVEALACTVDIQKAVADDNERHPDQQLKVRMGLNCGQVIKEEEDFFGGVVIVAARVSAMAKADQILVTEAVRVLAGLPRGIGYAHYGRRRLKGLNDSYNIWSVPWTGEEPGRLSKLRANRLVLIGAVGIGVILVAGGTFGALRLSRRGGGAAAIAQTAPTKLTIRFKSGGTARIASGDCKSSDLVLRDAGSTGEFSGDLSGRLSGSGEVTAYAATNCQTGYGKAIFTFTDATQTQNSVSGILEGPINAITLLTQPADAQAKAGLGSSMVATITGGSGAYDGATGTATCNTIISAKIQSDGSVPYDFEGDCKAQILTKASPAVASEPLVVQLAATPLKVAASGDTFNPANTVALAVVYGNTRDQPQGGLTLRVPVPEGATILASALGESGTPSPGERTWKLPDLGPSELKRFEFRLRLLSATAQTVPLTVEISGDGFNQPIVSNAVSIEVTH